MPATNATLVPVDDPAGCYLSLSQAAKVAPGRPSSSAIWRWCRRGVLARSGERIKLRHVRAGGKIYTTDAWVREFGERLAAADEAYFERGSTTDVSITPAAATPRQDHLAQIDRELEEAGL